MLEYYKHKYYFNAEHSPEADNRPSLDAEKKHSHTFQIELYVGASEAGGQHLFGDMDQNVREYLSQYEGGYLNDMPPFSGRGTTIEDIGEVFYGFEETDERQRISVISAGDFRKSSLCVYRVKPDHAAYALGP